ncbi:MAG: hypothetical protein CVT64_06960 [Actinobacteria bacterium HGW-Actinobacteria-4]|nr:MAG: hypothetical protein CVT64_06960 [Actinobacteria bacterium HGW-Actinobacteria-4]
MKLIINVAGLALALAALLSSCVQVPDAQSTGPFQPGRWESADGNYFLELSEEGNQVQGALPLVPSQPLGTTCDGSRWPEATPVDATWELWGPSDAQTSVSLVYHSDPLTTYAVALIEPGNWAVLEYYPCGFDDWPPLWLERVDDY